MMDLTPQLSALANPTRLLILTWLKSPGAHFGPEHPVNEDEGVCGLYIAQKLGVSPATASVHLKILTNAGFTRPLRIGKFTYFKRVEERFAALAQALGEI